MAGGMEGIIRPFVSPEVTPTRIFSGGKAAPPVHFSLGLRGGNKTFSYTASSSISSYMAAVHTEKSVDAFNMETGKVKS